nr:cilia- and flagella-associated protein 418-like [Cherax quadricarinatus]
MAGAAVWQRHGEFSAGQVEYRLQPYGHVDPFLACSLQLECQNDSGESPESVEHRHLTDGVLNAVEGELLKGLEQRSFVNEQEIMSVYMLQDKLIKGRPKYMKQLSLVNESVKSDDLKDLLDEFETPPQPLDINNISRTVKSESGESKKCSMPILSGTSCPKGMSTGATIRACDKLRCVACDSSVIMIDGFSWGNMTDYLFLRNNYPEVSRLRARLDSQRGSRAYACQCQHNSVRETKNIKSEYHLKWVCGGH